MGQKPIKAVDIVKDVFTSADLVILGMGGRGRVYTHPDYKQYAIKESKDQDVCEQWREEKQIQTNIGKYNEDYPESIVQVVQVKGYVEYGSRCYIIMDRICPLRGDPKDFKALIGKTFHALMGTSECIQNFGERGIGIGRDIIKDYIDLDQATIDLATFYAYLNFNLGYDGVDLEYIIGPICGTDSIKIYVLDFDQVGAFDVDKAQWGINAVPYFPIGDDCDYKDCDKEQKDEELRLGNLFWDTYIEHAHQYHKKTEAEMVKSATI